MRKLLLDFFKDEAGSITLEWAFVATILVLGAITGLVVARQSGLGETERPAVVQVR